MANRNDKEEQSNHPACAACKNQRKKCLSNCILRPHFPATKSDDFLAVHKIFGVANVTKMMREANSPADQDEIAKSLYWEAAMWVQDPVRGPYGSFTRLQDEIRVLREHLNRQRLLLLPNRNTAPANNNNNFHGNMMMNYNGNDGKALVTESGNYDNNRVMAAGAVSQRRWVESRYAIQQEGNTRGALSFSAPYRQLQGISMNEGNDFVSNNGYIGFQEGINYEELDTEGALSWQQQNYRSSKHDKIQ